MFMYIKVYSAAPYIVQLIKKTMFSVYLPENKERESEKKEKGGGGC